MIDGNLSILSVRMKSFIWFHLCPVLFLRSRPCVVLLMCRLFDLAFLIFFHNTELFAAFPIHVLDCGKQTWILFRTLCKRSKSQSCLVGMFSKKWLIFMHICMMLSLLWRVPFLSGKCVSIFQPLSLVSISRSCLGGEIKLAATLSESVQKRELPPRISHPPPPSIWFVFFSDFLPHAVVFCFFFLGRHNQSLFLSVALTPCHSRLDLANLREKAIVRTCRNINLV